MRLELMTCALRKRRVDGVSVKTGDSYDGSNLAVAGTVAVGAADSGRELVIISDDLRALIELWPRLDPEARSSLVGLAQRLAVSSD